MKLIYPTWLKQLVRGKESEFVINEETTVGTSGGKTSSLLAFLMDHYNRNSSHDLIFTFQNTGREHLKTYEFIKNLGDAVDTSLVWMEFRKPERYGAPPREARTELVDFDLADRTGKPFVDMLETLAEYRDFEKSQPPLAPNATMRLCTAYLKFKTWERFVRNILEWETYTHALGLRADEPDRVHRMTQGDTRDRTTIAPLASVGITKEHVNHFWNEQPFTLELPENLGNCTLCFLKDEADLAFNMYYESTKEEIQWWLDIQAKFGEFKRGTSYQNLLLEAPVRFEIRRQLNNDIEPKCPEDFDAYRFKLLVRQERKIKRSGIVRVPCSCEGSRMITDEVVLQ